MATKEKSQVKKKKKSTKPSTKQHLEIAEIRDDVVILKDGTLRSVLLVSLYNFAVASDMY